MSAETDYLIVCEPHCGCPLPGGRVLLEAPDEVGIYLWGRDVTAHIVYVGECPYRFFLGDARNIIAVLRQFAPHVVREALPLVVLRTSPTGESIFCIIGDIQ